MLMDLGLSTISLPVVGTMPTNSGMRLTLKSLYSNKKLLESVGFTIKEYNDWFELSFNNPEDFTNQGVEGYYELVLEYLDNSAWYEFNRLLVKCKNSRNLLDTPTEFISKNDDNENYTFYQS